MTKPPKFEETKIFPASASEGANNAFYHRCEAVEHMSGYASCLKKIADRKNGKLEAIFSICSSEIGQKRCPAIEMQKEEYLQDKAIYFIDRVAYQSFYQGQEVVLVPLAPYQPQTRRTTVSQPARALSEPAETNYVAPVVKSSTQEAGNDFAAAINAELSRSATMKAKSHVTQVGKSLLDIARARVAQKEA